VLGRCATGSIFDQQSDRVGLVLLPGGEAWIAAGKRLDLGAVVRGHADTWPVATSHRRLIRRHTIRERLNAKLRQVKANLRRMRHLPIPEQGRYLRLVLNGFYNYYAVPTNFPCPSTPSTTTCSAIGCAASGDEDSDTS
jgi:hypothetical protein